MTCICGLHATTLHDTGPVPFMALATSIVNNNQAVSRLIFYDIMSLQPLMNNVMRMSSIEFYIVTQ